LASRSRALKREKSQRPPLEITHFYDTVTL
jgi:hypothetical protein